MIKQITTYTLLFILISCVSKDAQEKKEIIYNLTNNNFKYWDVVKKPMWYDKNTTRGFPGYCYYFNKGNSFQFYQYIKGKRVLYNSGDIALPDTWKYLSDTTINLNGLPCNIIKLTPDTFIYSNYKDTIILSKSAGPNSQ
jgi:hypothetical protein